MDAVFHETVNCPYCGERITLLVDGSAGDQAYIEDCGVCCRPIEVNVFFGGDGWQLAVRRDDE